MTLLSTKSTRKIITLQLLKYLLLFITPILLIQFTQSQMIRSQSITGTGLSMPSNFIFNVIICLFQVYTAQTATVSFTTSCSHSHVNYYNSGGSYVTYFCTLNLINTYKSGSTYYSNINFAAGTGQKISITDNANCNWKISFTLNFNCSIVTPNCYDCSSYYTCTSCKNSYYLQSNICYSYPSYCLAMSGTLCTSCQSGYFVFSGVCKLCSTFIYYCSVCTSQTICITCIAGYQINSTFKCTLCSNFMANCVYCSNNSTCTTCLSGYVINSLNKCQLCSVSLSNCKTCSSLVICTTCNTGYALDTNKGCQACANFITDCVYCSSNTTCTQCNSGLSLQNSLCIPCTATISFCVTCDSTGHCVSCQYGYAIDPNDGLCYSCLDLNCLTCSSLNYCTKCSDYYYLKMVSTNKICSPCTDISHCINCTSSTVCVLCDNLYAISSSNGCQLCSTLITNCNDCINRNTCTSCDSGYALNAAGNCKTCEYFITSCLDCTDNSTCTSCGSGYLLIAETCQFCGIFLTHCILCDNINDCSTCSMGFAIDSFNKCKSCQFFIQNCDYCSDNSSCYMCKPAYFIYNGQCKTCQQLIPDCNTCASNTTCKICSPGFIYDLGTCLDCGNLIKFCSQCLSKTQCIQCIDPYTVDQNKKCKCKSPLYNISDLCIDDPNCVSVYKIGQYVKCSFCDLTKLYILNAYGRCVCKNGYQELNSICTQICGDGIIFKHQCDDNNTFNGDGCSSVCLIQKDYACTKLNSGMSNCKLNKSIEFKLDYTDKILTENKALIYISLNTQNSNVKKFYESMFFNYTLLSNRTDTIKILNTKKNQKGQIMFEVQYNETIQDTYMQLAFIYPKQKLISPDFYLKFQLKGNNYPLIISGYNEKYEQISKIQVNFIICSYVMVILMLLSDKFIAVEAINTFQMIFFSLLLIYNNKSWPQAFSTVLPLKYSTGFNQLIYEEKSFTNLMDLTFNKYRYVGMCEYFLLNNFTNSAIFILEFTTFIILYLIKNKIQRDIILTKENKLKEQLQNKLEKFSKVFRKFFNITFNFSYIMIFQILISLYIETAYLKNVSTFMLVLSKMSASLSFAAIIVTILQNYNHLFLTRLDYIAQNFKVGLIEARYKRVYFIYILINGFSIVLLNNK